LNNDFHGSHGSPRFSSTNHTTDSIVSRCDSGQKAVTRNAYLLFYRRRTPTPLGPPELQQLVKAAESDPSPDSDADDDEANNRSRPRDSHPDSGNGQRLDALSRNGSSSASTGTGVAAGAGALRGGGSHQLSARESPLKNAAGVGNQSDDENEYLTPYVDGANDDHDEGFVDAEEMYAPLNQYGYDEGPVWSFEGLGTSSLHRNDSDAASDAPNLGSEGGDLLENRLLQDFGDDMVSSHPGVSTPVEGIQPSLGGEMGDGDVHEIRVAGE
jgi:ubiquitin carboxyl-terminal hydrolase 4/11/15